MKRMKSDVFFLKLTSALLLFTIVFLVNLSLRLNKQLSEPRHLKLSESSFLFRPPSYSVPLRSSVEWNCTFASEIERAFRSHWQHGELENDAASLFLHRCIDRSKLHQFQLDVVVTHVDGNNAQFQKDWFELFLQRDLHCPVKAVELSHEFQQLLRVVAHLNASISSPENFSVHVHKKTSAQLVLLRKRLAHLCFEGQRARFRSWGELRFVLRSIEQQWERLHSSLPLSHRIFLVVPDASHVPSKLALSHPSIQLVMHRDLFSSWELPTFNSNAIESVIHRIPGLSRFFVYFNNDMLWGRRVSLFDYFRPRGNTPMTISPSRTLLHLEPVVYAERVTPTPSNVSQNATSHFYLTQLNLFSSYSKHTPSTHSFAHYPRVFDKRQLHSLLENAFAVESRATRKHRLARQDDDVWVPLQWDLWTEAALRNTPVNPPQCSAYSFFETSSSTCTISSTRRMYLFAQIRDLNDLRNLKRDLDKRSNKSELRFPLFITLNDDIDESIQTSDANGKPIFQEMQNLLGLITSDSP